MAKPYDCPHCGAEGAMYWKHQGKIVCQDCQGFLIRIKYNTRISGFHERKEIHGYIDIFDIIMLESDRSSKGFLSSLFEMNKRGGMV